jgi:DNA-binding beta-propeller fold protein YncE
MTRRGRVHLVAALVLVLIASLATMVPPAVADCPGAGDTCPYVSVAQVGQRGGGVLRFPQAVAVGPDGSIYVGDQASHVVQVFGPDGSFRREVGEAGTRPGQLSAVGSLAVAGDGTLLVADGGTNRIVRFDATGGLLGSFGGRGRAVGEFQFGAGGGNDAAAGGGLAVSGDMLYVADSGNDRVQRFTIDGGHGAEIVPPGVLANPRGLAVRNTRLLVADDQHHRVAAFDIGGRLLTSIGAGQGTGPGQLNYPYGVAIDGGGRVFVADDLNHRVARFSSAPVYPFKARWGSYGVQPGQLAYPRGIAVDASGAVYVANTGNDRVDVFDRSGALLRSFGASGRAPGQFDAPLGVATDAGGTRAVADSVNGRIQLLNPDGSIAAVWGSPNPGPTILPRPVAVAFDAGGDAYVLDQRRSRIVVFARGTGVPARTIGSEGSGPGQLLSPAALAIDATGTISVADTGNDRIARFSTAGDYLGSTPGVGAPRGIAVTPDGSRTYVADGVNRITVYAPDGAVVTEFGGTGSKLGKLNAPAQITLDAGGNLWVADRGNNRVQEFGPDGERLLTLGTRGTGPGELIHPTGVSVDCHGLLTVTDSDNNRLQQFALATPVPAACAALPPVANPAPPKLPTLPAPPGPQLSVRVLRTTGVLTSRNVPLRVGCDTTCTLSVSAAVTPRAKPPHGHKSVSVPLSKLQLRIPSGETRIVRLGLKIADVRRLRKALAGRLGLTATIQLAATAAAGEPTDVTKRLLLTG